MNYLFKKLEETCQRYSESSFFILNQQVLKDNLALWKSGNQKLQVAYSLKANYDPQLLSFFGSSSDFLEVASLYEFDMAKEYISPANIIVNGPIYSSHDLIKIIASGALLIIDSIQQLKILNQLNTKPKKVRLGVRVQMNGFPFSRFGVLENELTVFKENLPVDCEIEMVHCHYCDGFRSAKSFGERLTAIEKIRATHFPLVEELNIGGGFYSEMPPFLSAQFDEPIPKLIDYVETIQNNFPNHINVTTEIGAALVANAVDYCCKVVDCKEIAGRYLVVTNGSRWDIKPNRSAKNLPLELYTTNSSGERNKIEIVGYTCMEDDVLFDGEATVPSIGDYLIFKNCGAYAQSLSPDFIQHKKQTVNSTQLI